MAFAAMICIKGPPWFPGKTAMFNRCDIFWGFPFLKVKPKGLSKSSPIKISPPRGPLKVLWVVVVTTWQYGIGLLWSPEAIIPEGWEMSAKRNAPTSSAISRNLAKSMSLE